MTKLLNDDELSLTLEKFLWCRDHDGDHPWKDDTCMTKAQFCDLIKSQQQEARYNELLHVYDTDAVYFYDDNEEPTTVGKRIKELEATRNNPNNKEVMSLAISAVLIPIRGYELLYGVTNDGRVWSYRSDRFLAPYTDKKGYTLFTLCISGICKRRRAHRLVAEAFVSNPLNKPFINHIDSDRSNNYYQNLEWCTAQENTDHMMSEGRNVPPPVRTSQTHCRNGHPLEGDNIFNLWNGKRQCATCKRAYAREYWHRNKYKYGKKPKGEK